MKHDPNKKVVGVAGAEAAVGEGEADKVEAAIAAEGVAGIAEVVAVIGKNLIEPR